MAETYVHIAEGVPERAERWLQRIEAQLLLLAGMPDMGRAREEILPGLRSYVVGKHVAYYRALPDGIEVIRILHAARDTSDAFGE